MKPRVRAPESCKLGAVARACSPSTQEWKLETKEVKGILELCIKLDTSLGHSVSKWGGGVREMV